MSKELVFVQEDYIRFRDWLELNLYDLTWQGRYEEEFMDFWRIFFLDDLNFSQIMDRFKYAMTHVKVGPLYSWFKWLQDKFIVFCFINKNISVLDLSQQTGIELPKLSLVLRDFFRMKFPSFEDYFNDSFQISNITSPNVNLQFNQMDKTLPLSKEFDGKLPNDLLSNLEVTLYPEWKNFVKELKRRFYSDGFNIKKLKNKTSLSIQLKFIREFAILLVIGAGLIFLVTRVNEIYEKSLADKIQIFEPGLLWLDKALRFKSEDVDREEVKVNVKNLEDIEKAVSQKDDFYVETDLFQTESEVTLTSVDSLPRNFGVADLEQSNYEELNRTSYRQVRGGGNKVYRVLMNSVSPDETKVRISEIMDKFKAAQLGNVAPGTNVPGGMYYNLQVPREYLKEFLSKVTSIDKSTLYENRSRGQQLPGKNRVFIWVKKI